MAGNALAKLYSWADGVKRRVSNPLETIALGITRAGEDLGAAASDADIAYGRNGMKSVLLSEQQKAEAAERAAKFGEQMAMAATLYHGGNLVTKPTQIKQGVITSGVPAVSASPSMLEAARYAIHNQGPINLIDDAGMRIYQKGMNRSLDAAYKKGDFQAIRDAGYDGLKLAHSTERVLFDPEKVLAASKQIADNDHAFDARGVLKHFRRIGAAP